MKVGKKVLALLLTACMIIGLSAVMILPGTGARAAENPEAVSAEFISDKVVRIRFSKPVWDNGAPRGALLRVISNMESQNLQRPAPRNVAPAQNDHCQYGGELKIVKTGEGVTAETIDGKDYSDTYDWTISGPWSLGMILMTVQPGGQYEGCTLAMCIEESNVGTDGAVVAVLQDKDGNFLKATKNNGGAWDDCYIPIYCSNTEFAIQSVYWISDNQLSIKFTGGMVDQSGAPWWLRVLKEDGTLLEGVAWGFWADLDGGMDYGMRSLKSDDPAKSAPSYQNTVKPVLEANPGSKLIFCVEDSNQTGYIETYRSRATGQLLKADRVIEGHDAATCEVTNPDTGLRLLKTQLGGDNQVVFTFSAPVGNYAGYNCGIYPINAETGEALMDPTTTYWPVSNFAYSQDNQLVGTIYVPGHEGDSAWVQSFAAVRNYVQGLHPGVKIAFVAFMREVNRGPVFYIVSGNGRMEGLWEAGNMKNYVVANKAGSGAVGDSCEAVLDEDGITIKSVETISANVAKVTFSEGIAEGLLTGGSQTGKFFCFLNDQNILQSKDNNQKDWYQWSLNWTATDDPAVWYCVTSVNLYTLAEEIATGQYPGCHLGLRMEEVDRDKRTDLNGLVDNVTSLDGLTVAKGNQGPGWWDGLYASVTITPKAMAAVPQSSSKLIVKFSAPVKLNVTTPGVTPVDAVNGYSAVWQFDLGSDTDWSTYVLELEASEFISATGTGNAATSLKTTSDFTDADLGNVILGEDFNGTYNFMNADTGRSLMVGDTDEITITAAGSPNVFTFKIGDKFVDLSGNQPTLVDDSRAYVIRLNNSKGRYQILLNSNALVTDSDRGSSNAAELDLLSDDVNLMQTGWYLTRSGEQRPLRVMPVGDSITWGVNPDQGAPYYGYRAELSTLLLDYFGRVVFVGDQVTTMETLDSSILTRHFGYSGYTVKKVNANYQPDFWGNGSSIYLPATVDKYLPDVACLMLGINDIGAMGLWNTNINTKNYTDQGGLLDRYQEFVTALAAQMDGTEDTVFCSTLTPMTPDPETGADIPNNNVNRYNPLLRERITRMAAEGLPVVENDNNSACDTRESDLSSDRIHLSAQGYSKVAQRYAESIRMVYEATGVKRSYEVFLNAANGMGMSYTNKPYYNGNFTFSLEIPANLTGTPVVKVNGQPVAAQGGAYTVTGVTEDLEIEVTGLTVKTFKVTVPEVEGLNHEIINVGTGEAATLPAPYGTQLDLRFWLDEPYDQSELSVKVNGEPMEMTKDAFGTYYLSLGELTEDKTVEIDGVALNIWNVTEGANSSFMVGEGEDLTLVTDNPYLRPLLITLDGRELTEGEDYEVVGTESDTFNIILKKSFIDSLEAGEYGLGIHYPNGLAETTLTITAPPAPPTPTPPTSAEAAPAVFAGLGLLAVIGLGSALVLRKKTR